MAELILLPEALLDIRLASAWYDRERPGLAVRFQKSLNECLAAIQMTPLMHQVVEQPFRRALIKGFPYSVFYQVEDDKVYVHCVFQNSQDPEKWRQRLP